MGAGLPPPSSKNRPSFRPMAEINVTPMVDVMLVLLVVFMIAAPLINSEVPVEFPSNSAPALQEKEEPVTITVTLERAIFLGKDRVDPDALEEALRKATGNNLETRIYLRADQALTYGAVMGIMNCVREAGYTKVALVSEPEKSSQKKRKR